MDTAHLTDEQLAIVNHPMGKHARVLAVAGSGKTETMVYRAKHLVEDVGIDPATIDVYMFNKDAGRQFAERLARVMPGQNWSDRVHTFHAAALGIIAKGERRGVIPPYAEKWLDAAGETKQRRLLNSIIRRMVREGVAKEGELTVEEAIQTIGRWKASLVGVDQVETSHDQPYGRVYTEFEEERRRIPALTFDDFVPVAVSILRRDQDLLAGEVSRRAFMIVDEYQDINEGQEQFMRLIAGDRSDVMVVGDDDQTIYEWRGARPEYILDGFARDFGNKDVVEYPLSQSFRFGPLLAQVAYNTITVNKNRAAKELVAHDSELSTEVNIVSSAGSSPIDVEAELAGRLGSLLRDDVSAKSIMVLGRTFAQMEPLEAQCLSARVPFFVRGKDPFFRRSEDLVLVNYLRLALLLDEPVSSMSPWLRFPDQRDGNERRGLQGAVEMVLSTVNSPRRYISHDDVERGLLNALGFGWTMRHTLDWLSTVDGGIERSQVRENVAQYLNVLVRIQSHREKERSLLAGDLLAWILKESGYAEELQGVETGDEENPDDRETSVMNFISYARDTQLSPNDFVDHLQSLDTTCGKPMDECVTFTSIHRAKGLQADYVFLPGCVDGTMPLRLHDRSRKHGGGSALSAASCDIDAAMESERRLFYVAVTRARRQLNIGTCSSFRCIDGSPFLTEMELSKTRPAVLAFWNAMKASPRSINDAACRCFMRVLAQMSLSEKVRQYVFGHYVPQLPIPRLRNRMEAIAKQGGQPLLATLRQKQLYHITRVNNLGGIFSSQLECFDGASNRRQYTALPDEVNRRRADPIPLTGRPTSAYVPLSFCIDSPFLHDLTAVPSVHFENQHHRRHGALMDNDDIAILCLDAGVLDLDGAIYTDSDDRSASAGFYDVHEAFCPIDWKAVIAADCSDETVSESKSAEALIPSHVPVRFITSVILHSDTVLASVQDMLCDLAEQYPERDKLFAHLISLLEVRPEAYFAQETHRALASKEKA